MRLGQLRARIDCTTIYINDDGTCPSNNYGIAAKYTLLQVRFHNILGRQHQPSLAQHRLHRGLVRTQRTLLPIGDEGYVPQRALVSHNEEGSQR
jgi:hypothetical protein